MGEGCGSSGGCWASAGPSGAGYLIPCNVLRRVGTACRPMGGADGMGPDLFCRDACYLYEMRM